MQAHRQTEEVMVTLPKSVSQLHLPLAAGKLLHDSSRPDKLQVVASGGADGRQHIFTVACRYLKEESACPVLGGGWAAIKNQLQLKPGISILLHRHSSPGHILMERLTDLAPDSAAPMRLASADMSMPPDAAASDATEENTKEAGPVAGAAGEVIATAG